jgi:hypothetical protein
MRAISILVSVVIVLLGLVFMIASTEGKTIPRLLVGAVLVAGGAVVGIHAARQKRSGAAGGIQQRIELSGDVGLEQITCRQCGGALDKSSVTVKAGAVFVSCPYCSAAYQLEEKPKW